MCIVVEEIDESEYWLEVIKDAELVSDVDNLTRLIAEANELNKIMTKAKSSVYQTK